jgi:large subunit ribosomal protein L30
MSPEKRTAEKKTAEKKTGTGPTDSAEAYLLVKQVRSGIGTKPKHRGTLRALGLRGVGRERVLPDRPEVRGMIARVPYLVEVGTASAEQVETQHAAQAKALAARRAYDRGAGSEDAGAQGDSK